jgi:hypothetical protein
MLGSASNGTWTAAHGLWIQVGDRKFLATTYYFSFNESRVLTTITKARINYQLSSDGKTLTGTMEVVVFKPDGEVIGTFPGTTVSLTRLSPKYQVTFTNSRSCLSPEIRLGAKRLMSFRQRGLNRRPNSRLGRGAR